MGTGAEIAGLKPMCLETNLVAGGEARCVISPPDDAAHRALAERLADALEALSGARVPVEAGAVPERAHVIALGQMINHPLIERLYWNQYTFADSLWPGEGGWSVQTVHNPYPWTSGRNAIVLAGSDAAGVGKAVEAFLEGLDRGATLSIPPTLRVQLPPPDRRATGHVVLGWNYTAARIPAKDLTADDARALREAYPEETLLAFQEHAAQYLITGELAHIESGRKVLLRMCEVYETAPDRKMTWPEETNSRSIFAMWDAVEEAPVFSDGDRLRIARMLLRFLDALVGLTSDYARLEENDTILWNHTTFPLMGLYRGGRYFRRYYGLDRMDVYLTKAGRAFAGQERSWKPQCDADAYLVLTIGHTIEYALAEGKMAFFENGNIRRYADYLMGISDNRGRAPGFGDSGPVRDAHIPLSGVPYAFWYTRDPVYLGYLNAISGGRWPNPYHQDVRPVPPEDLPGVQVYPLDRQVYEYTQRRPYYGEPSGPPNIPFDHAFDKVAFRAGAGESDQYFILDGYGRGKHLHYDTNAILKLTEDGEDWLIDADYLVRNTTEHNMVSVVRDGRADGIVPECAGLLHVADLPGFGLSDTVVRGYNGADWHRNIFWRKGDWVVVFDCMHAKRAGEFRFDCVWKTFDQGAGLEEGDTFISRRPGGDGAGERTFFVRNASGAKATLRRRTGTAGRVVMLTQRLAARLSEDEWLTHQNLLYMNRAGREKGYCLRRLSDPMAVLLTPEPVILRAGRWAWEGLRAEAALSCLGAERMAFAGLRRLTLGSWSLSADLAVSMEVDVVGREATVVATTDAVIVADGLPPIPIPAGTRRVSLRISDEAQEALARALDRAARADKVLPISHSTGRGETGGLRECWRIEPGEVRPEIRSVAVLRDGGGERRLLICRGREVRCHEADGALRWTFPTPELVRCVTTADVDGDGRPEILCGGNDEHVHVLDEDGRELRRHRMVEQLIVGQGGTREPFVNALLAGDLRGDGEAQIVAGCTNSQISMFDADFLRVWNRGGIYHGVRKLMPADVNGDGALEILAADHYGSVHVISLEGERVGGAYSELGDVAFDGGDIDGDGFLEIVNGSGTGVTAAFDREFKLRWTFNNYGYNTREVVCRDLDGDGLAEAVVASDTGYVYVLGTDGGVKWQRDLGAPVVALAAIQGEGHGTRLAAGLGDGGVVLLNAAGEATASFEGPAPVRFIIGADLEGKGRGQIVVVDTDDRLRVLEEGR